MASIIEICNLALGRIGDIFISSLDDNSKEARMCSRFYDVTRQQLLVSHPWTFASVFDASLSPVVATPELKFAYAFQVPTDCVKVQGLYQPKTDFMLSGSMIYSDDETINLVYTQDVTDPGLFSVMFTSTLSLKLAYVLSYGLSASSALIKMIFQMYQIEFMEARRIDNSSRDFDITPPVEPPKGRHRYWREVR